MTDDETIFDVREIPCQIKHPQIMQRFFGLPVGAFFVLANDHDPVPLYYQFDALFPTAFRWEYLERGPETCRIKITKLAPVIPPAHLGSPCAGEDEPSAVAGEIDAREALGGKPQR